MKLRKKEFHKYQELTGMLYRGGVTLLAGTDALFPFVPPGYSLHQELEMLVESGLSPASALQSATIHNAQILQEAGNLGSIEKGKIADLVLLRKNPLSNIKNTRTITKVIRGGKIIDLEKIKNRYTQ